MFGGQVAELVRRYDFELLAKKSERLATYRFESCPDFKNKTMKIYTEEDVLKMLKSFHTSEFNVQLSMAKLTPIEIHQETTFTSSQTEKCPNCLEQNPLHSLCLDCIVDIGKSAQIETIKIH